MNPSTRWRLSLARGLVTSGAVLLLWSGIVVVHSRLYGREQRDVLATLKRHAGEAAPEAPAGRSGPARLESNALVGVLDIPRIGLSEVVAEGEGDGTLDIAIGHLPDTPLPWMAGNSALAGHRDRHFGPLKDLRTGDHLTLSTPYGDFRYRVTRLLIVTPEDVWVLNPTPSPTLTLITCYPFRFVGHAPQRFIVQAERVDGHASLR